METVNLFGLPQSLFTGRVRSYFIKACIPYRQKRLNTLHFHKQVKPKASGRVSMPTIEFADGTVICDSTSIIDHFEGKTGNPFSPPTPRQNVISLLVDAVGVEGFLRPAMHYRWNFYDEYKALNDHQFSLVVKPGDGADARLQMLIKTVRSLPLVMAGLSENNTELIEKVYKNQLCALNNHFSRNGYLLGGRPCLGDFGLMTALYAHLGRDPKPLELMLKTAPFVFRWVERMNTAEPGLLDFENEEETWIPNDQIPDSLINFLSAMAEDFVPESQAAAKTLNLWLSNRPDLKSGTPCARGLGLSKFELRGEQISAAAQVYRFFMLKRFQDAYDALGGSDLAAVDDILEKSGFAEIVTVRLLRDVGLVENQEVWL